MDQSHLRPRRRERFVLAVLESVVDTKQLETRLFSSFFSRKKTSRVVISFWKSHPGH